ncbi:hypothetical protein FDO65_08690 [Nakamurella flava]|uniref:LPXTG cell wall anchor domain-containing protein n=1 Tax=Nakamurella flava TaxID=2576308 RepID=A0A4U6QMH5_9ACTN|nr:hypothetical protein [Nakamurella flava]TKV61621.1 hypothetical protein FDO65_08690 [Nakamurella flava]
MTRTTDRGPHPALRPDLRRGLATVTAVLAGSASMLIATDALADSGTTTPTASTTAAPGEDCLDVTSVSDGAVVIAGHGFPAGDAVTFHLGTTAAAPGQRVTATAGGDAVFTLPRAGDATETILTATGEPSGRSCAARLTGDAITPVTPAAPLPAATTTVPTASTPSSAATTTPTTPSTPASTAVSTPMPTPTTTLSSGAVSVPPASITPSSSVPSTTLPSTTLPSTSVSSTLLPSTASATTTTSAATASTDSTTTTTGPTPEAQVLNAQRAAELPAARPVQQPWQPRMQATEELPAPKVPQQDTLPGDTSDLNNPVGDSSTSDPYAVTTSDPYADPTSDSLPSSAPVTFGQWSVPSYPSESVTPYVAPSYAPTTTAPTTDGPTTTALASTGVPVAELAVPGLLLSIGGALLTLMGRRRGLTGRRSGRHS